MRLGFWPLTVASAISKLGNTLLYFVAPLALLAYTHSSTLAILSLGVQSLPYLFSAVLGDLIDRHDRRWLFILSELGQAAVVGILPLFLIGRQIGAIFVCLLVVGTGSIISNITSDYSLLPSLVAPERLTWAYSRYSALLMVARFAGPALAGIIVGTIGSAWALWIDAATFVLTAGVATFLPRAPRKQANTLGVGSSILQGLRYVATNRGLRYLTGALATYNVGTGGLAVAILTIAKLNWGLSIQGVGLLLSGGALAAAIGSWVYGRTDPGRSMEQQIGWWLGFCALGALCLPFTNALLTLTGYYLISFGEGGMNAATMTYRRRIISPEYIGRANATIRTFTFSAVPLSSLLFSYSTQSAHTLFSLSPAVIATAAGCLLWMAYLFGSWRLRSNPPQAVIVKATDRGGPE